jgi:hypothetical protein
VDVFGYQGTNLNAQKLIDGKILPNELDNENDFLLQILQKLGEGRVAEISKEITF